jgi:hypothetical protein
MSWGLAAGWLAVAGTTLLTFGTGAQAVGNLAEFKDLQRIASDRAKRALAKHDLEAAVRTTLAVSLATATQNPMLAVLAIPPELIPRHPWIPRWLRSWLRAARRLLRWAQSKLAALVSYPGRLQDLRAKGGDEAVRLAQYLRAARIWAILMIGSALALAGAAIQLALTYQ